MAGTSVQHACAFALVVFGDAVANGVSNPGALLMGDVGSAPAAGLFLLDGGIGAGDRKEMRRGQSALAFCCDEAEDTL